MLYVIQAIGHDLYKIGYSSADPERRLEDLQTGCPYDLKTILLMDGERADEARIHNFLKEKGLHVRSEWFEIKSYHLFELLAEMALKREIKSNAVSIYSSTASVKMFEEKVLDDWLTKFWKFEKQSSFSSDLGTSFTKVFNDYFLYCKRFTLKSVDAASLSKKLDELKIGRKLDRTGDYIYNMKPR
jgi:hypothetical protein